MTLTDQQLDNLLEYAKAPESAPASRLIYLAVEAVHELRERRASDLSSAEMDALQWLRDKVGATSPFRRTDQHRLAIELLDKLLVTLGANAERDGLGAKL
jgi:hypothetical protein